MELEQDHQQQSSQRKQVSAFRLPDRWKPNGANETAWNNNKIQRIPNGANEAVLLKWSLQWIPNFANEAAVRPNCSLQWIPNGANEADARPNYLIQWIPNGDNDAVSNFSCFLSLSFNFQMIANIFSNIFV